MARALNLRRRDLVALGAVATVLGPTQAQEPPRTLQIVGPWEIGGLAPASSGYIFTRMQITETLTDATDDGTPLPGLAQSWNVSANGRVWRFSLREKARFHDGTPVTAAAVAACLSKALVAPAMLSLAGVERIAADGPSQLSIHLRAPFGPLPSVLAHSSAMVLAPASYAPDGSVRAIVGSGPYRVTRLTPPQHVEAALFDAYDLAQPIVRQVRYLAAGRSETRALMAESGQADLAYGLDAASLARLTGKARVRIQSVVLPRTILLKVNAGLPALRDVRVRLALSLAIDRQGIGRAILRDPELAASQLFAPSLPAWHQKELPPLRHDPGEAQKLLASAGWQRHPDGLRDAQGQPLRLVLRTFPDRPELPIIASALQAQWRQAGIAAQVHIGNSGDIPLGHRDGSLQLGLAARNYANVPDPAVTILQDFGPHGGDWGAMGWRNPAVDDALARLSQGHVAAGAAAQLRARIASSIHEALPVIPICWYRQHVAINQRLQGVSLDPLERSYRLTQARWNG